MLKRTAVGLVNVVMGDYGYVKTAKRGGSSLKVIGKGDLSPWGSFGICPELSKDMLISVGVLDERGWSSTFQGGKCVIRDAGGNVIATGFKSARKQYTLDCTVSPSHAALAEFAGVATDEQRVATNSARQANLQLQEAWGHVSWDALKKLASQSIIELSPERQKAGLPQCPTCITANMTRRAKKKGARRGLDMQSTGAHDRAQRKCERVHSDISGPMSVAGMDGAKWFITFIDDKTRRARVHLMQSKSEAAERLRQYGAEMAAESLVIGTLRTDGEQVYVEGNVREYCLSNGIKREITPS
jgi:hypothetical protein